MPAPDDLQELELVRKAIDLVEVSGCLEWDEKEEKRLRARPPIANLYPDEVTELLVQFVRNGGTIFQKKETRKEWQHRRNYWYKVNIPYQGLLKGLFVEFYLFDEDPDYPSVSLVNYHQ
jgi:hypothetical protein